MVMSHYAHAAEKFMKNCGGFPKMMAGSITLGTYDTFNYRAAQAEKDLSQWLVE